MERLIPLVMLRVLVCRGSFFEPTQTASAATGVKI